MNACKEKLVRSRQCVMQDGDVVLFCFTVMAEAGT